VILFTSFSGSLVSRIPGAVQYAYATGNEIYLLHAFVKKTQKTPTKVIEIARMRLKEMK
ncbi:type II toxin-antitoxin system RelE/ParE family toxin, partial [Shigella flexneri]